MKRILTIFTLALIFMSAPVARAEFRWGVNAGININDLKFKQDITPVSSTIGGQANVIGELMFPGIGFGVDFGLGYNMQGAKVDLGSKVIWQTEGYGKENLAVHNLYIPLHLRFKYTRLDGLEDKIAPLLYVGPEMNIQIGHSKCDAIKYSGGDLGVTLGVGAELFKRFQLTGAYTWGMTYVLKTRLLQNYSAKSSQWSVRLAYYF